MKKLLLHLAALAGLLLPATSAATAAESTPVLNPVKLLGDSAYFSKFTYEWINDAGKTCTAHLTDVATDPRQIYALIAKVYTDPDIPGKIKVSPVEGDKADTVSNVVYYSGKAWAHWNPGVKGQLNVNENIPAPKTDEQTMLLVEVKDKFDEDGATRYPDNSTIACIYHCIKSVRLLYSAFRIERNGQGFSASNTSYKPGVVYNVSGTYNRFFLMGKGSNRPVLNGEPFDRMFEQYSPTTGVDTIPVTDFYQQLKSGQSYTVKHDCGSVPHLGHFPTMASTSGTAGAETMSNLLVYIPDYRLAPWSGRDTNQGQVWCMYNPDYIPRFDVYAVKLAAKAERYGQESDRQFKVTLNWESNIDTLSDSRVKQDFYIYRVVNGVIESKPINSTPINDYTYSYLQPQNENGQTLTYIITGRPSGISGFNPVESNQASVLIPGYDPYERLALDIEATSRSKYDADRQVNEYTNHIVVDNNAYTHVTGDFIGEGTQFHLYRYDSDNSDAARTEIATITIQSKTTDGKSYNFDYKLQMQNQAETVNDTYGSFTAASAKGDVNFNNLEVVDHFTASTAANAHIDHYDYVLEFMPLVAAGSDGVKNIYSNSVRLTVPKTEFSLSMDPYTKAQVDGDTDHSLELPEGVHMTVQAANSSAVRSYTLYRSGTAFAELQRADNGNYSILTRNAGSQRPNHAVAEGLAAGKLTATDDLRDATAGTCTFYPVINAECTLASGEVATNTYGADQKLATPLSVKVINPTTKSTKPFAYDATSWKMGFGCYFEAKGIFDKDLMSAYNYRVWRIDDDGTETQLSQNMYDDDDNPNVAGNYKFSIGGDQDDLLDVSDLFIDKPLKATDTKTVNYIVRIYGQDKADESKFYVAEDRFSVTYDANTPTGIGAVERPAAQVASVRYVDATGRQSLTPLSGFSIVVTTYTDGTVTTAKRIQR